MPMVGIENRIILYKSLLANARIVFAGPSVCLFLARYMGKFKLRNINGQLIIHSHLPPVNSKAFTRFVKEHLQGSSKGASHAQIGLTNICPQNCGYCYNKDREGEVMTRDQILDLIGDLKGLGVFWLGLTGGEPLMNKDIVEIIRSVGDNCAIKLFTTGSGLTEELAGDLRKAGLLYVSISLDHWMEKEHDKIRGCEGAYQTALKAIELFLDSGIHVSVSGVLSREMIREDYARNFLEFLIGLGVHEAWLSEAKPATPDFWNSASVITDEERRSLIELQDSYNKEGRITVNYLGHFESGENFGCNAGSKMIYIDAFGEVSPCVFVPLTFGNVKHESIRAIHSGMSKMFFPGRRCFINENYELIKKYYKGHLPIGQEDGAKLMGEIGIGPLPEFMRLLKKHRRR